MIPAVSAYFTVYANTLADAQVKAQSELDKLAPPDTLPPDTRWLLDLAARPYSRAGDGAIVHWEWAVTAILHKAGS